MKIIDNELKVKLKVVATDGRRVEQIIPLKELIEKYIAEDDILDYLSEYVCDCQHNFEYGFDPCSCGEAFWETDSENISVEIVEI